MKLIETLKIIVSRLKSTLTRNDYRWFFIPTIQYHKYNVAVYDEGKEEYKQEYRDTGVKAHFLCYTLTIYNKRTPI